MEQQVNNQSEIRTLGAFFQENDKILGAIGVLIALSAFFASLPIKQFAGFLSFCCLMATFPLLFEFLRALNKGNNTWSLLIFSNVFFIFFLNFSWYVLLAYRAQWQTEMHRVVFWTVFLGLLGLYRRFFRKQYLRLFRYIGFPVEKAGHELWIRLGILQLEYWIRLHFFEQILFYFRSSFSAACWRGRAIRKVELELKKKRDGLATELANRWRLNDLSTELQTFATLLLFVPIWFLVGAIDRPVADLINVALDIQAEEYQRNEQQIDKPEKLHVVPPPESTL